MTSIALGFVPMVALLAVLLWRGLELKLGDIELEAHGLSWLYLKGFGWGLHWVRGETLIIDRYGRNIWPGID